MTRKRRGGIAVALGLGLAAVTTPAAAASPAAATPAALSPDAGIVELSVAGDREATTLFGDVVVVPGDTQTRSVEVANVGTLPGTLTVEIVDATLTGAPAAFFDHLTINGVTATDLDGVTTAIAPARTLAPGEVVTVPVTLAFDVVNPAPDHGRTFTFAVRATLTGDTPTDPSPGPGEGPGPGPADPGTDAGTGTGAGAGTDAGTDVGTTRADTGGALAINRANLLWAAGALLAGGLLALIPVLRRRRNGEPE